MKASRGEITIAEILTEAELDFKEEYSFPDLVSNTGRPLRFDFAVFDDGGDLDFLIEYQGIQHYESIDFFGGENAFMHRQNLDNRKRHLCEENGLNLIAWPYTDEITEKSLEDKISTIREKVPQ